MIKKLDQSNFYDTISNAEKPIIVDFYADWCGPCKMLSPIMEELARENEGSVVICKVNVDDNPEIASRYAVAGIPMFVSFKNGQVHKRMVGAAPKQTIIGLIE